MSRSLSETNYLRTGVKTEGLLDVHVMTDEDVKNRSGYAAKIGAVTDAARTLPLRSAASLQGSPVDAQGASRGA